MNPRLFAGTFCSCLFSLFICFLAGCKKDDGKPAFRTFHHSLVYKVQATTPSPADSARGIYRDSIILDKVTSDSNFDKTYLNNFPFLTSTIIDGFGFGLAYDNPDLPFAHFLFSADAFPGVTREFNLNTPYESSTQATESVRFFLGRSNGLDGWNYFVNNDYPPDTDPVVHSTYTKIIFTKKEKFVISIADTTILADGSITGYTIDRYSQTNPDKYVHRLDFSIDFKSLAITE